MLLAGDVAHEKNPVREGAANSGLDGTGRKPRTVKLGAKQGAACAVAVPQNVQKRNVRRAAPWVVPAATRQHIPANAAREADAVPVGVDHTAIAARENQQWHQISRQIAISETRFEGEQIAFGVRAGSGRRQGAVLP
jgi:hypothetical protein